MPKKENYIYDDVKNKCVFINKDGTEEFQLSFGQLTRYLSDSPYYEWIINDKKFVFNSEKELFKQEKFLILCFRFLRFLPYKFSKYDWYKILNLSLSNRVEIDEADYIADSTTFMLLLHEFFERRAQALNKEQIKIGIPYKDEKKKNYLFKAHILEKFLKEQGFKSYTNTQLLMKLKDIGAESKHYLIKDFDYYRPRIWVLPFKALEKYYDKADVPKIDHNNEEEY